MANILTELLFVGFRIYVYWSIDVFQDLSELLDLAEKGDYNKVHNYMSDDHPSTQSTEDQESNIYEKMKESEAGQEEEEILFCFGKALGKDLSKFKPARQVFDVKQEHSESW